MPKSQSLVTINLLKLMLKTGNARWIRYQIMMSKKEYQRDLSISSKIYIAIWDQWMSGNNVIRGNNLWRKIWCQCRKWWWHQWACQLFKKKCKRNRRSKAKQNLDFSARLPNSFQKNQRKILIAIWKNLKNKIRTMYKKRKSKSRSKVTHSQCNKILNRSEWMMNSLLNFFQLLNQKKASGDYNFKFNQILKIITFYLCK